MGVHTLRAKGLPFAGPALTAWLTFLRAF